MLTGELKNKVDKIWETLWTAGISNPLTVLNSSPISSLSKDWMMSRLGRRRRRSERVPRLKTEPFRMMKNT